MTENVSRKKLAIVGCGFLGGIVAGAVRDGLLPEYELVGVTSRTLAHAKAVADAAGCAAYATPEELLAQKPDYVVETAGGPALRAIALPVLSAGASLVCISIGAFADEAFYESVRACAAAHGVKVHIASGAVGGFDVLRTVSLMAAAQKLPEAAGIWTHKGPASLKNTPIFEDSLLADTAEKTVFDGSAKEAIALFPTKVNVAVAAALATTGPQAAGVKITSVPGFVGDDHAITAEIPGVKATVDIYSSTSAIAGWSIVSLLQNLASPVQFQ